MTQLQEFFQFLMAKVKEKADLKKNLAEWIGPYDGKVLQVHTEEGDQYIVVTREDMTLHEGIYPSPDVIYKANSATLLAIFTGETPFKDTMADGRLTVIGNANESDPLANLILAAMMSM
ncbi:MAG: SCP2 sterol-binding domain-containing protein [Candidatus Thorarchaeota archaeon]|nr:SCP2 sterol-binding domain-containing protein [Candidatus Thorarchaeota archaeon]